MNGDDLKSFSVPENVREKWFKSILIRFLWLYYHTMTEGILGKARVYFSPQVSGHSPSVSKVKSRNSRPELVDRSWSSSHGGELHTDLLRATCSVSFLIFPLPGMTPPTMG